MTTSGPCVRAVCYLPDARWIIATTSSFGKRCPRIRRSKRSFATSLFGSRCCGLTETGVALSLTAGYRQLLISRMKTTSVWPHDLRGVFAVPPLARNRDVARSIDFAQNDLIARHIVRGGVTRLIYGGNAFLYHITLADYEQLIEWLAGFDEELWIVPSVGPSFGRAMDQANLLRKFQFPCVMMLPCSDPRDDVGLERGYREIAGAADTKLILYLKDEHNFGPDK